MDERERLLSAIAADPDAIENWLVYADWLTDRGELIGDAVMRLVDKMKARLPKP